MRRRLTSDEAAIWAKVASTVTPIKGRRAGTPRTTEPPKALVEFTPPPLVKKTA
jgi:hypothetical protein